MYSELGDLGYLGLSLSLTRDGRYTSSMSFDCFGKNEDRTTGTWELHEGSFVLLSSGLPLLDVKDSRRLRIVHVDSSLGLELGDDSGALWSPLVRVPE